MAKAKYSIYFSIFLLVIFTYAVIDALTFAKLARFFPLYIAAIAVFFALMDLILNIYRYLKLRKSEQREQEDQEDTEEFTGTVRYMIWIIGYVTGIYILGFMITTTLFLVLFLLFETKFGIIKTSVSTAITIGIILLFGNMMNLYWPKGLLNIF
ncbi:tripartite tricarboxylate transporter TctB family protein [Melghiribacillus thermohalophilus]|uniref:Tripartite tricarboxylate transporter TctB family protein n=1 Tax=Melghiribacillus thermohalophilus TaxID=1324956 RepID=A0A4R3N4P0_9BACI|nr:tripartite tricarboxylate transporter TctB family protein [Melghiribacillus thermohalophilus]TCT21709.1 tripartite tricarboxylate transporter TctB family protein [Melghiribacillus thermohalophilus]